ncbi:MAG: carbohydrate kinase [Pirellulaceae bacterium]|nr:carbohydrate kinase [Pirellulaceae bacterium]
MSSTYQVAAIGEMLWDIFPSGPRFGGAPANFACSLANLSGPQTHVSLISAAGNDPLGREAISSLQLHGVDTERVKVLPQPTGKVLIELDQDGRATYEFASDTAWDNLPWSEDLLTFAESLDAVYFGTLGQRDNVSRDTILRFLNATQEQTFRIFDLNLRPPFINDGHILASIEAANVLKLNDEELPILAQLCRITGSDRRILEQLADRFQFRAIALTRGAEGAFLLRGSEWDDRPAAITRIVDTVGAGDAYTAALVMGLLRNDPLSIINEKACTVAEFVCTQAGATPHLPAAITKIRPN